MTDAVGTAGRPDLAAGTSRPPTGPEGLSAAEVAARVARGEVNAVESQSSRPLRVIIRTNVVTRFNALLGVLFLIVIALRRPADGLFGLVVVWNAVIGIVQEVRAKRTLDRLAVLNAPSATVVRDGAEQVVPPGEVVLDDLVVLRAGDQVTADGVVRASNGLEIDESLLTGESEPVDKQVGDAVLSGSFVVAGSGTFQTTAVGEAAYANQLATEARRFTRTRSELMAGIDRLLLWISWGMVVIGPVLLVSQLLRDDESTEEVLVGTVAALVGMVPEGLVLLTSIAFMVGALTLARRRVLVQELPAVEGLARVDVVCLDKTGTLTDGTITFAELEALPAWAGTDPRVVLAALADDPSPNATIAALAEAFGTDSPLQRTASTPFSSARKWSAAQFAEHGTWVLGAPEIVGATLSDDALRAHIDERASSGQRVLLLAHSEADLAGEELPPGLAPVALVLFAEELRADAPETMRYLQAQQVALKVISGDNPRTVAAVARRVDVPDVGEPVDARSLPENPEEAAGAIDEHTVFGRVTPDQKRRFVTALQRRGHVVAMTGDGVNDALALKDADIGVAMGSGAPATRAVAQIVLLDGRFSHIPTVVAEGRRVMANIERVASLFLIKNVYSAMLALAVSVVGVPYPFLPRHLTVISALTIGIPAFLLSLAPSNQRYRPGFLRRVLLFSVPTGALCAAGVLLSYGLARAEDVHPDEARTAVTIVVMVIGLWVLVLVAQPLNTWKTALIVSMAGVFVAGLAIPPVRDLLELDIPVTVLPQALAIGAAGAAGTTAVWRASRRRSGVVDAA